jgi:hypothetical protein
VTGIFYVPVPVQKLIKTTTPTRGNRGYYLKFLSAEIIAPKIHWCSLVFKKCKLATSVPYLSGTVPTGTLFGLYRTVSEFWTRIGVWSESGSSICLFIYYCGLYDLGGAERGQAAGGRLRPLWHTGEPHQRPPQVRGQGPHCGQQQRRSEVAKA